MGRNNIALLTTPVKRSLGVAIIGVGRKNAVRLLVDRRLLLDAGVCGGFSAI